MSTPEEGIATGIRYNHQQAALNESYGQMPVSLVARTAREITFAQAINEALAEEMRRDPTVFIIGEDVAEAGTPFKVLSGLADEFGTERVIDSPISEAGISRHRRRRRHDRHAAGGRYHVRRFSSP